MPIYAYLVTPILFTPVTYPFFSMTSYTKERSLSSMILLGIFAILSLIYVFSLLCPSRVGVYNDAGIFQYIGWRIANGYHLYSDVWDHKGPVIFAVNALGYLFPSKGSIGVYTVIYVLACLSLFAFYKAFRTRLPASYAAAAVLCLLLFELDILAQPVLNTVENTALFFVSIGLWLFLKNEGKERFTRITPCLLGVLTSCIFWTKGNYIGFGCFLLTYWSLAAFCNSKKVKPLWNNIIWSAAGFFASSAALALYFVARGDFADFLDGSLLYNANEYHIADFKQIIKELISFTSFVCLQLSALIFLVAAWLFKKCKDAQSMTHWIKSNLLYLSLCVWFVIEIVMCCIKGVVFSHYLIMTYPPILFCAFMTLRQIARSTKYSHLLLLFTLLLLITPIAWGIGQKLRTFDAQKIHIYKDKQVDSLLALNPDCQPIATFGGIFTTRILVETRTLDPQKYCINKLVDKNKISPKRRKEMEADFLKTIKKPSIRVLLSEKAAQDIFPNNTAIQQELENWRLVDRQPSGLPYLHLYYYIKL